MGHRAPKLFTPAKRASRRKPTRCVLMLQATIGATKLAPSARERMGENWRYKLKLTRAWTYKPSTCSSGRSNKGRQALWGCFLIMGAFRPMKPVEIHKAVVGGVRQFALRCRSPSSHHKPGTSSAATRSFSARPCGRSKHPALRDVAPPKCSPLRHHTKESRRPKQKRPKPANTELASKLAEPMSNKMNRV